MCFCDDFSTRKCYSFNNYLQICFASRALALDMKVVVGYSWFDEFVKPKQSVVQSLLYTQAGNRH
jgi:hypothetical protein